SERRHVSSVSGGKGQRVSWREREAGGQICGTVERRNAARIVAECDGSFDCAGRQPKYELSVQRRSGGSSLSAWRAHPAYSSTRRIRVRRWASEPSTDYAARLALR